MENLEYLFAGYTVVFLLLFGYMWSIARRQKEIERQLRGLSDSRKAKSELA